MIKIENVEVYGWEAAIRGMRNPMNSWDKSDSFCDFNNCGSKCPDNQKCDRYFSERDTGRPYRSCKGNFHYIGPNDLNLMTRLLNAGTDHCKFMRMITVYMDITAPLYWWKEFDTYKVGTVANSCSTMHKLTAKEFTLDDFSHEHLTLIHTEDSPLGGCHSVDPLKNTIEFLNVYREYYNNATDPEWRKRYWWQMIQLLPSSYNQRRTVQLNYEVLRRMYYARRNHKLDEWVDFCKWVEGLPNFKSICCND